MEQLLTVAQAAEQLRIGRTLTWRLVRRGGLPVVRIGRAVRINRADLDAWVAAHTAGVAGGLPAAGLVSPEASPAASGDDGRPRT